MEYWHCDKADQRKRGGHPRSEIEGREIVPGTSYSRRSYGAMELLCDLFKEPEVPVPNPHARVTTPRTATIAAVKNIKDIAERKKEMI